MIRSIHRGMPAIPKGYALAPNASWFSVLTPIARTNLVINPSFEIDTTQYGVTGASISRVATQQYHGAYSLQITPSAGVGSNGAYHGPIALTSAQLYACSCKFLGVAGVGYKIAVDDTSNAEIVSYRFVATGRWQWVWVYYLETSSTNRRFAFKKNNNASVAPFYVDGVQVEAIAAGEAVSTYIDGDQAGLVPNQFPPAYVWTGTPHGSTSTRSSQTRAGGVVMRLDYYGFVLLAMLGLGVPTPSNVSVPYALLDGAQYERTQKPPRGFTLGGRWDSASFPQLQRQIGRLGAALDRDAVGQQQPLTLLYQALDSCDSPISDPARIVCSYQGGLEGVTDNLHAEQASIVFRMWMPLIQGDGESGAALNAAASVANANFVVMKTAAGVWQAMGTGLTGGLARCALALPDGTFIVGGDFTQAGGVANTAGIARYTPATDTWSALGTGAAGGVVYNLASSPNGAQLYAVGTFTSMGGVANTKFVAKFVAGAWSALQAGYAAGTGVFAVAYATPTTVILGGDQSTNGGVSQYNPTANTLAAALAVNVGGQVRSIVLPYDNSVMYVGGSFTTLGGTPAANVAKYTFSGATVAALGSGMNNTVDSLTLALDGSLYAGGLFTTAGGVTANRVARFIGSAWQPLGSGMDAEVSRVAIAPDGSLWATGLFTTAGGVTLLGGAAIWRGNAWTFPDFQIPGTADARAIAFKADGTAVLGFNSSGTGTAGLATTVTNPGTARSYPVITFTGPTTNAARLYNIQNRTTNRAIYFSLSLLPGETATLTTTPDNLSFVSSSRGNIIGSILPGSNEADFFLQPGANTLAFFVADASVTATLHFRPQYTGAGDLTP
jgi:hypothetical protein